MTTFRRHRFAWTPNELERIHREYENQERTIQQIAVLHERSIRSILFKLVSEELIEDWSQARGYNDYAEEMGYPIYSKSLDQDEDEDQDEEDNQEDDDEDYEEDNQEDDDEDYEEDEDEDDQDDEDYDPYSMKQQLSFMQTQINNLRKIVSGILYDSSNKNVKTAKKTSVDCYI